MIGKAIAHESGATFFSISSSSLTSKWEGEGEKLVRTLFAVAQYRAPSVIFIDEVDSMLTHRSSEENESSRKMKTEFFTRMDGVRNEREGNVLFIGTTNIPQELDEAARRRFVKRLYVPLPCQAARKTLIGSLLEKEDVRHIMTDEDIRQIAQQTEGYSGADLKALCRDAAMGPIREVGEERIWNVDVKDVPPISSEHFRKSLCEVKPSVAKADLKVFEKWDKAYGYGSKPSALHSVQG